MLDLCASASLAFSSTVDSTSLCSSLFRSSTVTSTVYSTVTPTPVIITHSVTATDAPVIATSIVNGGTITVTIHVTKMPTVTADSTSYVFKDTSCLSAVTTPLAGLHNIRRRDRLRPRRQEEKLDERNAELSTTKTSTKRDANIIEILPIPPVKSINTISACLCLSLASPTTTTKTIATTLPAKTSDTRKTVTLMPTRSTVITSRVTVTATVTVDHTVTLTPTATLFKPNGLTYFAYRVNYDYHNAGFGKVPAVVNSLSRNHSDVDTGTVRNINTFTATSRVFTTPDGYSSSPGSNVAVVLQGYFLANGGPGTYHIVIPKENDDIGIIWKGVKALANNWHFENSDVYNMFYPKQSVTLAFSAAPGEAIPMTLLWGNTDQVGQSQFNIVTPDGTVYTDTSKFFIQDCGLGFNP